LDAKSRTEAHQSAVVIASAALKARELKDGFAQDSLEAAEEEIARLRHQLKESKDRERHSESALDAALQDARAALRKAQEDAHALTVQCDAVVEARTLVERRLVESENVVLKLKSLLDAEKEKVTLQREWLMNKKALDDIL